MWWDMTAHARKCASAMRGGDYDGCGGDAVRRDDGARCGDVMTVRYEEMMVL
jgi:hypothetical protein